MSARRSIESWAETCGPKFQNRFGSAQKLSARAGLGRDGPNLGPHPYSKKKKNHECKHKKKFIFQFAKKF
jgi:hypothetical protein